MNKLQKTLRQNAIFSTISGITLIGLHEQIARMFGTTNTTVFWVTGLILLFFSSTILYEIIKQRPIAVLWIVIQDILWVIGSWAIIAINPFGISKTGTCVIAIIAFIVLFMGINQSRALAQVDTISSNGTKQLKYERIIKASRQDVWKVISDVANYDKVAPNIDNVKIISGKGHGMVRSCSHKKDSWTESCTMWNEEKSYSFEVNTSDVNYPYPFKFLKGTWEVQEIDSSTSKISMYFEFQYKRKYQNVLLHPILKGKFQKTVNELLNNWQTMLEK